MNTSIDTLLEFKGHQIYSVPSFTTVVEAVREMNAHNIGSVLVMDGGQLLGLFSARDVLRKVIAEEYDPRTTQVGEVMHVQYPLLTPNMTSDEAMRIFEEQHCRHLPVIHDGLVVGVISIGDLSRWCATADRAEAESLRNYITASLSS